MSDTKKCDVPGCNQFIRFVRVDRKRFDETTFQVWVAVNVTPSKQGALLDGASLFVFADNIGLEVAADDRETRYERGDHLYVEHARTCFDPNWRRLNKALGADDQREIGEG